MEKGEKRCNEDSRGGAKTGGTWVQWWRPQESSLPHSRWQLKLERSLQATWQVSAPQGQVVGAVRGQGGQGPSWQGLLQRWPQARARWQGAPQLGSGAPHLRWVWRRGRVTHSRPGHTGEGTCCVGAPQLRR